jgi:hypothetical protein
MIDRNMSLKRKLKVLASTKVIVHRDDGSTYTAISADAGGAFGEGLDFVVFDELAQTKNTALYDALMTSLGSQVEPLMMVISTQASSDEHLLSELIDYGLKIEQGVIEDDSMPRRRAAKSQTKRSGSGPIRRSATIATSMSSGRRCRERRNCHRSKRPSGTCI